eukprot:TRINITY_DN2399_c0_g1_i5.p1 TRINITY_DN2399_c0_g1~~TRINITY_DN2399_c0_g1_i5.p1  ORF type:complete len:153 (-),score=2.68 TRINITY_DN2399_c0_g1_i5:177-635(-)
MSGYDDKTSNQMQTNITQKSKATTPAMDPKKQDVSIQLEDYDDDCEIQKIRATSFQATHHFLQQSERGREKFIGIIGTAAQISKEVRAMARACTTQRGYMKSRTYFFELAFPNWKIVLSVSSSSLYRQFFVTHDLSINQQCDLYHQLKIATR